MVKILLSYDMQRGKEEACQRYVMQTLAPGLARLGLRITDAWYTMWGDTPQILGGGVVPDVDRADEILHSPDWHELVKGLLPYVENFDVRVIKADGRIQL
jgi:hypothetical protein